MRCADNNYYVVKFQNNPQHTRVLVNDWLGTRLAEMLRSLRSVTNDYTVPEDACISYRTLYDALRGFESDLHQHIHLENNILFPRAVAMEAHQ